MSRMAALMGLVLVAVCTVGSVSGAKTALTFGWVPEFPSYYIGEEDISCVISVKAPKKVAAVRAPISVTAVLDASGSMEGLPISALKNTAEYMVEALGPADYLGVVTYNDFVYETAQLASVDISVKPSIKAALRSIIAGGGTNLSGGLFAGIDQQKRGQAPYSKYVLLFTDGKPNGGIEDINEIEAYMAGELAEEGSPIVYSLGFGYEQDPNFLYRIAHAGRGSYVYVNSAADIATSFGQILGGLLSVYAHDIHCTLTPLGGASIKRVQTGGYITPGAESWQLFFADLYAAEERDILIDMKIPVLLSPKNKQQVLQVDVTYFDPFTGEPYSAKPIIVVIERTLVPRPVYVVPAPVVDIARVRYRCADDIERAVILSGEGKYLEAKKVLDGTLAYIAGSSVINEKQVQQYREDCVIVQKVVEKEEVIPAPVAAGYIAAAKSYADQRAAGVTNDLKGPGYFTTAPKQEEATKAKAFAEPVIPATAESTAVGFADATVSDDGTVSAVVENNAFVDGEDTGATSEATSTANGADANAEAESTATADSGATESGDATAEAISDSTAIGEDSNAESLGTSTAIAGSEGGDATATTISTATASAPVEGDATATATGESIAFAPEGQATAVTTTIADAFAPEGAATATADGSAFAQGQDAFAAAPTVATATGETADAIATGGAEAFAGDEGDATAVGDASASAFGQEGAFAEANAPAYAISGEDGSSRATGTANAEAITVEGPAGADANANALADTGAGGDAVANGNADAFAVSAEGPASATGDATAVAGAGEGGTADATANGSGVASGTDATAAGSGDATAIVGEEAATASGSGSVDIAGDSVTSSSEGSATGEGATATATSSAVSGGKGGPKGKAKGTGEATAADGAAEASASGTAEAFAPVPAPEPAPLDG